MFSNLKIIFVQSEKCIDYSFSQHRKKKGTEIKPMENENDKDYPVVKDCEKYPVI